MSHYNMSMVVEEEEEDQFEDSPEYGGRRGTRSLDVPVQRLQRLLQNPDRQHSRGRVESERAEPQQRLWQLELEQCMAQQRIELQQLHARQQQELQQLQLDQLQQLHALQTDQRAELEELHIRQADEARDHRRSSRAAHSFSFRANPAPSPRHSTPRAGRVAIDEERRQEMPFNRGAREELAVDFDRLSREEIRGRGKASLPLAGRDVVDSSIRQYDYLSPSGSASHLLRGRDGPSLADRSFSGGAREEWDEEDYDSIRQLDYGRREEMRGRGRASLPLANRSFNGYNDDCMRGSDGDGYGRERVRRRRRGEAMGRRGSGNQSFRMD